MSEVRFGLVGYGAWGRCHAQAVERTPGARLAAVAVRREAGRGEAAVAHPDAAALADYRELISRDDVDVVDIVVPSDVHFETAAAALQAGKHVLLEKPMALTVAHCDRLAELARSAGVVLAVGHELRLSSLWGRVKRLIDDGAIGRPQYVLVELSRKPYRLGSGGWRYQIERVGSWVLEEPIHFFDLARWYLSGEGPPQTVFATGNSRQEGRPELLDNFSAVVQFPGGAYAVVTQTLAAFEHHQTVKVSGTRGAIWASWSGAMDRVREAAHRLRVLSGETLEEVEIGAPSGELFELESEIAMMVDAVRGRGPVAVGGEDGRWSVAMCLAAEESVKRGEPVAVR